MNPSLAIHKLRISVSVERAVALALLLLGALLRLRQYLTGRSLWADEAMLALNIVNRNLAGMFKPLDYDQGAPIGFLLVEKFFNLLLGKNEFVLRLFPLIVGLLSLWLFYLLLQRITTGPAVLIALALFAFNPRLVYYSSEVKQYIVDVAVTITLLWLVAPLLGPPLRRRDLIFLTIAGVIALWFSHPALFVLAGIGLALVIIHLRQRDFANLRIVLGMGCVWFLNVGLLYLLILKDLSQNAYMREYWQGAFVPMPPWSDLGWFMRCVAENLRVQFGMPYAVFLVFTLMVAGWVVMLTRRRHYAIVFACIFLLTLFASALQLYPIFERMILFLVPMGLILLGEAVEELHQQTQRQRWLNTLSVLLLTGFLVAGPVVTSAQNFVSPKYAEHIRPSLEHLRDSWKPGDALYVSNGALPAFQFYAPFYGLETIPYEFGQREDYQTPQHILSRLDLFDGKPRVWILFSHVYEKGAFNEKDYALSHLNQIGEKKREFRVPGTSVYLYLYDLEQ